MAHNIGWGKIFIYLFILLKIQSKPSVNVTRVPSPKFAAKLSSQEMASLPQTNRSCNKTKNQLRILNINFQCLRKKGKQLEPVIDAINIVFGTDTWTLVLLK